MKKTERRLVKVQGIEFLKNRVAGDLERLEDNFKDRHKTNAIKLQMKKLHQDLFLLRAAEKQFPMPLKIQSIPHGKYDFPHGQDLYFIQKLFYCQNCGHEMLENYYGNLDSVKYCPYCGQKLWWPKN